MAIHLCSTIDFVRSEKFKMAQKSAIYRQRKRAVSELMENASILDERIKKIQILNSSTNRSANETVNADINHSTGNKQPNIRCHVSYDSNDCA